jgi:hypothetical protein
MPKKVRTPRIERLPGKAFQTDPTELLEVVRKNFDELARYFEANGQFNGFTALSFDLALGSTREKINHGLGFVPRDVVLTRLLAPSGTLLRLHHSEFTDQHLVVSMTGSGTTPAQVRLLVGTFNRGEEGVDMFTPGQILQEFKAIL